MAADDRYRLAGLRDARAIAERGKQHALASRLDDTRAAQAQLDTARARTLAARSALAAAVAARDALLATPPVDPLLTSPPVDPLLTSPPVDATLASPPVDATLVQRADAFIARRRRELAALTADEVRIEANLSTHNAASERARGSLIRARTERELIDRHFARWRESRRKLADRRDD